VREAPAETCQDLVPAGAQSTRGNLLRPGPCGCA